MNWGIVPLQDRFLLLGEQLSTVHDEHWVKYVCTLTHLVKRAGLGAPN